MLRYHGLIGFFSKAWEKIIVDRIRFRGEDLGQAFAIPFHPTDQKILAPDDNRPLNILYLVHYFFPERTGGTERFTLTQALEQQKKGRSVHILTLTVDGMKSCRDTTQGIRSYDYEYGGLPVTAFCYHKTPLGLYYKRIKEDDHRMEIFAHKILDQLQPDIVHCVYAQPMATFLRVCRQRSIPYLITLTGFDSICHYTTMLDKKGQLCKGSDKGNRCGRICKTYGISDYHQRYEIARRYLQGAAVVTAPSRYVAAVVNQEFSGQQVRVVPHGITKGKVISRNKPVRRFAFVGTLTELKGVHILINAFADMQQDASLYIYGSGTETYVHALKQQTKNDARIVWCGSCNPNEIHIAYELADCVVIPSLVPETYNYVIREALSYGCIVVASDIGALSEVVHTDKNGYLAKAGSVVSLYQALQSAYQFKWKDYQQIELPSVQEETEQYGALYCAALESKKERE